ncbi:MAG: PrsW family intramembrane metalloprotease [Myxococcales bacterium]|nr:PrsW family intramembrane metalloprotease [Myxococcales bacterium]
MDPLAILGVALMLFPTMAMLAICRHALRGGHGPASFLFLFFAGAMSVIPVLIIGRLIYAFVVLPEGAITRPLFEAFGMAALIEEGCKFAVFASLGYLVRNELKPSQAIWAGIALACGFATVENFKFMLVFGADDIELSLLRGLLVLPAHALDGALLGYVFARAKFRPRHSTRLTLLLGYLAVVTAHGLYDFMLLSDFGLSFLAFGVSLVEALIVAWGVLQLRGIDAQLDRCVMVLEPDVADRRPAWQSELWLRAPTVSTLLASRSISD